ncbi:MAG: YidC/Oxa1 family membrane protein insertase [Bacilli bacterium]
MNKFTKRLMLGVGVFGTLFLVSSCTASFVTVNDRACLVDEYVNENFDEINEAAEEAGYFLPGDAYWDYIDEKVDEAFNYAVANASTQNFAPESYVESYIEYLSATTDEEKESLVNESTLKAVIKYAGYNSDGEEELWANFDMWTEEASNDEELKDVAPTNAYLTYFKDNVDEETGTILTGLTPESGYYGINRDTFVEGKTWGQAFSEYGFIEGLLVYPIGWLLYHFTLAFGVEGNGQILAIFLVTLICRSIIVLASLNSSSNQMKMTELQPELQKIQAKYPNAKTNQYEQQKLAAEQQALYKKHDVHPFKQMLILIIQFPIFISVWGALQGSSILTTGSVFGLQLSTTTYTAITAWDFTGETPFAIVLFLLMAIAQFFSTRMSIWIQNWRKSRIVGNKTVKVQEDSTQTSMMKYLPWIMLVFIVFMGLNLPAAMGIYWFFGALISIFQTFLTEFINSYKKGSKHKDKKTKYTKYNKVKKSKKSKYMKLK